MQLQTLDQIITELRRLSELADHCVGDPALNPVTEAMIADVHYQLDDAIQALEEREWFQVELTRFQEEKALAELRQMSRRGVTPERGD